MPRGPNLARDVRRRHRSSSGCQGSFRRMSGELRGIQVSERKPVELKGSNNQGELLRDKAGKGNWQIMQEPGVIIGIYGTFVQRLMESPKETERNARRVYSQACIFYRWSPYEADKVSTINPIEQT